MSKEGGHNRTKGIEGFSEWEVKTICQSYTNGATKKELEKRFHTSDKLIRIILEANEIKIRGRGKGLPSKSKYKSDYSVMPKVNLSNKTRGHRRRGR